MTYRSGITCLVLMILAFTLATGDIAVADPANTNEITAEAYILMDADSGKILKARNEHLRLPPASMTKLMTLVLAMEALDKGQASKSDQVVTSHHAFEMGGTQLYLAPGEIMTLDDMLIGITLASANDASVAVAEHLAGSEKDFVKRMNKKAAKLGMKDTYYQNACGLPAEGHYSSAYDMAVLARYALAHTRITEYTSLKQYQLRQGKTELYNSNKLLWRCQGTDGLKTGYTAEAKLCLTATARRGNLRLIAVVMGCPQADGNFKDAGALLDYGFDHYSFKNLLTGGTACGTVKVTGGAQKNVAAIVKDTVGAIYPRDQEKKLTSQTHLNSSVQAPVHKGQKLGEILIYNDQELLKKVNVLAVRDVPRARLVWRIMRIVGITILIIIFIIIILMLLARYYIRKHHLVFRRKV